MQTESAGPLTNLIIGDGCVGAILQSLNQMDLRSGRRLSRLSGSMADPRQRQLPHSQESGKLSPGSHVRFDAMKGKGGSSMSVSSVGDPREKCRLNGASGRSWLTKRPRPRTPDLPVHRLDLCVKYG